MNAPTFESFLLTVILLPFQVKHSQSLKMMERKTNHAQSRLSCKHVFHVPGKQGEHFTLTL
jgi:hypothetical protein